MNQVPDVVQRAFLKAVLIALCALGCWTPAALADFGVTPGTYAASVSSLQAGGHPDLSIAFTFNSHPAPDAPFFGTAPDADVKDVLVHLAPGLVGNPQAYPVCSADFMTLHRYCPWDTQVGVIVYRTASPFPTLYEPIYNMVPQNGRPAEFAFLNTVFNVTIPSHIFASVRTGGDYGVTATTPNLPANLKPLSATVTLWGVPADPSHDGERGAEEAGGCLATVGGPTGSLCPSQTQPKAFFSNPTLCGVSQSIGLTADSWQVPGLFVPLLQSVPQQFAGCDKLRFNPSFSLQPTSSERSQPSGGTFAIHIPQTERAEALATPHLKKTVVSLSPGVVISPSAADGLQGCSDTQIGLDNAQVSACPPASKIGTVEIISPLIASPLTGSVYQGTQTPEHLLRIFIVAKGSGVLVKQAGSIDLDPVTGQITAVVDEIPQLPFSDFTLKFKGGARAPLANPRSCGTTAASMALTSWAGQTVSSGNSVAIVDSSPSACRAYGFSPEFRAGIDNPIGGASSSLTLYFNRGDRDQEFRSGAFTLPRGLLGHLKGFPLCDPKSGAAGTCGEPSRIGTVTTSAGPGPHPFFLKGRVYLTDSFDGHPFGLSIVVPAKAGPLDLGNVVVRASLDVRNDGSLRVVSDPFPRILEGIPLQVRSVQVDVDRPDFIVNPTNCHEMRADGQIGSVDGATANVSSRFQLTACDRLLFAPKLELSVGRKGRTGARSSTPLTARLTQSKGQAAMRTVKVVLPDVLNARLGVVSRACTIQEFRSRHCEQARAGSAVAVTPLLGKPLRGNVYLVKNPARQLPDLVVALRGQVDIDLTGKVEILDNIHITTTFTAVPDVPLTSFTLKLTEGRNGPLGVAENLCTQQARAARATLTFTAQNDKRFTRRARLSIRGCSAKPTSARGR